MVEFVCSQGRGSAFENPAQVYSSPPPREAEIPISNDNKVQELVVKVSQWRAVIA